MEHKKETDETLFERVTGLIAAGKVREAAVLADEAYHRNPQSGLAMNAKGYVLDEQGDHNASLEIYRKGIKIFPEEPFWCCRTSGLCLKLGGTLVTRDRPTADLLFREACTAAERALELAPREATYVVVLAYACAAAGDYKRAIAMFERFLTMRQNDVAALHTLGDTYMLDGQYDEAIARYKMVLSLDPKHPDVRSNILKCHLNKGDLISAAASLFKTY